MKFSLSMLFVCLMVSCATEPAWTKRIYTDDDLEKTKLLFSDVNEVNLPDSTGTTLLMVASALGRIELVRFLLEKGADINAQDKYGDTALMDAASDHPEVVELLLEKGADVNIRNKLGKTALEWAIGLEKPNIDSIRILLEKGAGASNAEELMSTAEKMIKHYTCSKEFYELTKFFNKKEITFNVSLLLAVCSGDLAEVKKLVEDGENVNLKDPDDGSTALMFASQRGYAEIVMLLVENGADVNLNNNNGWTALIKAVYNGHIDIVKFLLERDADVNSLAAFKIAGSYTPQQESCGTCKDQYGAPFACNCRITQHKSSTPDKEIKFAALDIAVDRKMAELLLQYGAKQFYCNPPQKLYKFIYCK